MEEKIVIDALRTLKKVFDRHDVEFWLQSGVLLGAIREGKFIQWDHDIDLGTWEKNMPKMRVLTEEFCSMGYETYFSPYHNVIYMKKGQIDAHLVFWRLTNNRAIIPLRYIENSLGFFLSAITWALLFSHNGKVNYETLRTTTNKIMFCLAKLTDYFSESFKLRLAVLLRKIAEKTGNRRGLVVTPSHYFENLSEIDFYGMKFKIPLEAESYLAFNYGEDWRIPRREWSYIREDRKIISKTEMVGENWDYFCVRDNPALTRRGTHRG